MRHLIINAGELKETMSHVQSRFLITIPALLPIAKAAVQQCPRVKVRNLQAWAETEGGTTDPQI